MPATDFTWPVNEGPPIYHLYSAKRKHTEIAGDPSAVHFEIATKRRCPAEDSMEDEHMEMFMEQVPSHDCHQPISLSHEQPIRSQDPVQQQQLSCAMQNSSDRTNHIYSYLKDRLPQPSGDNLPLDSIGQGLLENNNNNIACLPAHHTTNISTHSNSQNDVVMDLSEEAHNTAQLSSNSPVLTDAEYEARCSLEARSNMEARSSMEAEGAPDHQQYSLAFCDRYCVGGDTSPTSGIVRCFCKPSWEGMTNMRPYVSDYY